MQKYLWCRKDGKSMIYHSELEEDDFVKKIWAIDLCYDYLKKNIHLCYEYKVCGLPYKLNKVLDTEYFTGDIILKNGEIKFIEDRIMKEDISFPVIENWLELLPKECWEDVILKKLKLMFEKRYK